MAAAKQIINVGLDKKLTLDQNALKKILRDEIKDLPVVVISIVGTYRQGKSFIMNFFLRFLSLTCQETRSVEDWLNPRAGTLSGFVWKNSSQRETVGIMMWPEIFISRLPSGEDVAIVLLDTQGTYDNQTSIKDFAAITALSTLISSVQIYNMMNTIKQNELMSLKDFLDYGQLINKEHCGAPFQNLILLIRDWNNVQEYPFGEAGGQSYMKNELSFNPEDDEDLTNLKKSVLKFFTSTSAFLLPAPGDQVVRNATNSLAEMDYHFKVYVKLLVERILSPENLVIKRINGTKVTVSDLPILIEKYHEQFQSGKMPPIKSLFQATAEVQNQLAVEEYVKFYEDSMSFDENPDGQSENKLNLRTRHVAKVRLTLEEFDKKKKMGDERTKREYREKLVEKIETVFRHHYKLNQMKLKREKEEREKQELMEKNQEIYETAVALQEDLKKAKDKSEQYKKEKYEMEMKLRAEAAKEKKELMKMNEEIHKTAVALQEDLKYAKVKSEQDKKEKYEMEMKLRAEAAREKKELMKMNEEIYTMAVALQEDLKYAKVKSEQDKKEKYEMEMNLRAEAAREKKEFMKMNEEMHKTVVTLMEDLRSPTVKNEQLKKQQYEMEMKLRAEATKEKEILIKRNEEIHKTVNVILERLKYEKNKQENSEMKNRLLELQKEMNGNERRRQEIEAKTRNAINQKICRALSMSSGSGSSIRSYSPVRSYVGSSIRSYSPVRSYVGSSIRSYSPVPIVM